MKKENYIFNFYLFIIMSIIFIIDNIFENKYKKDIKLNEINCVFKEKELKYKQDLLNFKIMKYKGLKYESSF